MDTDRAQARPRSGQVERGLTKIQEAVTTPILLRLALRAKRDTSPDLRHVIYKTGTGRWVPFLDGDPVPYEFVVKAPGGETDPVYDRNYWLRILVEDMRPEVVEDMRLKKKEGTSWDLRLKHSASIPGGGFRFRLVLTDVGKTYKKSEYAFRLLGSKEAPRCEALLVEQIGKEKWWVVPAGRSLEPVFVVLNISTKSGDPIPRPPRRSSNSW